MRRPIISLLVLSATAIGAQAQPGHGPGGGHPAAPPAAAAPHPAPAPAPAPHMAAPAPPPAAAAPHIAAPHVASPPPAAPRMAPHVAAPVPHAPAPHIAAPAPPATPHLVAPRAAQREPSQRLSAQPPNVQRQPSAQAPGQRGSTARGAPAPAPQITQRPTENRNAAAPSGPSGRNAQARPETSAAQQQPGGRLAPGRNPAQGIASPEPRNPSQVPAQVTSRVTPQAAAQGRFAAPFVSRTLQQRAIALPAQDAWRQLRRAAFVAWAGPVFWPYVYTDMFYYAFWPTAYDDGYWAYAYDNVLDGSFWAYGDPYSAFAYAGPNPDTAGLTPGTMRGRPRAIGGGGTAGRQVVAACAQGANVADLPFEQIQASIDLDPNQQALFRNLKEAAESAAAAIRNSCPSAFPLTPPGRLQSMIARLEGTVSAIDKIRPALVAFYSSLNDEQKARFNAIGPDLGPSQGPQAASLPATSNSCGGAKPGLIDLPIDQIEAAVRPTDAQQRALDQLRQASGNAVNALSSACPDAIPGTPVGRLDAMRERFATMLQAAQMLQPALDNFYASLNNEQKAAFNTLGQTKQSRG